LSQHNEEFIFLFSAFEFRKELDLSGFGWPIMARTDPR